jgi:hypothetical protein
MSDYTFYHYGGNGHRAYTETVSVSGPPNSGASYPKTPTMHANGFGCLWLALGIPVFALCAMFSFLTGQPISSNSNPDSIGFGHWVGVDGNGTAPVKTARS